MEQSYPSVQIEHIQIDLLKLVQIRKNNQISNRHQYTYKINKIKSRGECLNFQRTVTYLALEGNFFVDAREGVGHGGQEENHHAKYGVVRGVAQQLGDQRHDDTCNNQPSTRVVRPAIAASNNINMVCKYKLLLEL